MGSDEVERAARALAIQLAPIYRDMIPLEQAVDFATPVIRSALARPRDEVTPAPAAPKCYACGKPATCEGYEGAPSPVVPSMPACDDCCGHGNEDGKCWPITTTPRPVTPDDSHCGCGAAVGEPHRRGCVGMPPAPAAPKCGTVGTTSEDALAFHLGEIATPPRPVTPDDSKGALAAERERCAKVCEHRAATIQAAFGHPASSREAAAWRDHAKQEALDCAAEIRALRDEHCDEAKG